MKPCAKPNTVYTTLSLSVDLPLCLWPGELPGIYTTSPPDGIFEIESMRAVLVSPNNKEVRTIQNFIYLTLIIGEHIYDSAYLYKWKKEIKLSTPKSILPLVEYGVKINNLKSETISSSTPISLRIDLIGNRLAR